MPLSSIARPRDQVVTASPDTPAREIARYMHEQVVGSVIVVDEREPVGIVTDRDLAIEVVCKDRDVDTPARTIMTRDLATVRESDGVARACKVMQRNHVRRLPVVDDDDGLVGIVTLDDLVLLLEDELEDIAEVIRYESPPF